MSEQAIKRLMLDGLDAAMQARVAKLFEVYCGPDGDAGRFEKGLEHTVLRYDRAVSIVEEMFADDPVET